MQKWEYKTILRSRAWKTKQKDQSWVESGNWDIAEIRPELERLGEEGWELVAVSTRSDYGSQTIGYNYAGFTSTELWVFKRPKP